MDQTREGYRRLDAKRCPGAPSSCTADRGMTRVRWIATFLLPSPARTSSSPPDGDDGAALAPAAAVRPPARTVDHDVFDHSHDTSLERKLR
jgi:hypothetical protein